MTRFIREIAPYAPQIVEGAFTTLKICGFAYLIGIPLGILVGILRGRNRAFFSRVLSYLTFIFSAIPFLVILFWLHYPLQQLMGIAVDSQITAVFALVLLAVAFTSDAVATAVSSFPKELIEMAKGLQIAEKTLLFRLLIPEIFRRIVPQVLVVITLVLHASLFCSFISVNEIFRVAQSINSNIYRPIEIFSLMAIFLLAVSAIILVCSKNLKRRWDV